MEKFLDSIDQLGRRIELKYRRANADQRALPEIAGAALEEFDEVDGVGVDTVARFIQYTRISQQARNPFSDLPVTVFRARDFYIELLVWSHATTAIHQHGFSGAFRVVRGSSIHTRYQFSPQQRISDDCLVGDVRTLGSEYLGPGSVRRIEPGRDGLVHSLYHLDNPSITLVARSCGHSAFGPQYTFYPPGLALHRSALGADELVLMYSRLLNILSDSDRQLFQSVLVDQIAVLDFPRVAWLYLEHHDLLDDEALEAFSRCLDSQHGELAWHLKAALERYATQKTLKNLRKQVHDSDLRFFIALLLNVSNRQQLLEMVKARFPQADPVERCADWLARLSVGEQSARQRMTEIARTMESSGLEALAFGRLLRRALPDGAGPAAARGIFRQFIEKNATSPGQDQDFVTEETEQALRVLDRVPQLSSLRSTTRAFSETASRSPA